MELDPGPAIDNPSRRPFQFSLRSLLIVMTITAVLLSGLFAGPGWTVTVTAYIVCIVWPMVVVVTLVYCRGWARTFCIGALFPVVPLLAMAYFFTIAFAFEGYDSSDVEFEERVRLGLTFLLVCVSSILCGTLALGVRRMVEPSGRRKASRRAAENPEDARPEYGRST